MGKGNGVKILTDEEMYDIFKREYCSPESNGGMRYGRAIEAAIIERIGEPRAWIKSNGDAVYLSKPDDVFQYEQLFAIRGVE